MSDDDVPKQPAHNGSPHRRRNHGALLPADILRFAREMRSDTTDAESKLWCFLRSRRFDGFKFRRQHSIGRYIVDFYCHEARLAIELDGGQHALPEQAEYDTDRERALRERGVRVLRFWDNHALKNTQEMLQDIWDALHGQGR